VDCLAIPGEEPAVIAWAAHHLARRGVDLIVTNQSHESWCGALAANGFFAGPSNFIFAASPGLAALLEPFDEAQRRALEAEAARYGAFLGRQAVVRV
jgi:hypothetical protein